MTPGAHVYAFACSIALTAPLLAQNPPPAQIPTGQPSASVQAAATMVKIEGCVFKEVDAPGRKVPDDVRSRVETDDDYVLTNTVMLPGPVLPVSAGQTGAAATGTAGSAPVAAMYKVKDISKAKLKDEIGRRVQIEGTLEQVERAGKPLTFAFDLVELRGTTIRRVEGECEKQK